MLIFHCESVYWMILQHWQVDWYLIWSHRRPIELEVHHYRRVSKRLLVHNITRSNCVPSNVTVRVNGQLHRNLMLLDAAA